MCPALSLKDPFIIFICYYILALDFLMSWWVQLDQRTDINMSLH